MTFINSAKLREEILVGLQSLAGDPNGGVKADLLLWRYLTEVLQVPDIAEAWVTAKVGGETTEEEAK